MLENATERDRKFERTSLTNLHSKNEAKASRDTECDGIVEELLGGGGDNSTANDSMTRVDRGSRGWKGEDQSWNDDVGREPGDRIFC
jgi:hypothetical protein